MTTNGIHRIGEDILGKDILGEIRIEDREILEKYISASQEIITPATATTILSLIKNFGRNFVEEAINVAVIRKNLRLDYIIGILDSWKNKGFKTLEDIEKERKKEIDSEYKYQRDQENELDFIYEN